MSLIEYEEAAALLRTDPTLFLCTGPCDEALVALAERTLEVTFPETYRRFVSEFGASPDVLGLINATFEVAFRFDAVGRNLEYQRDWELPARYMAVHDFGDGEIDCLYLSQVEQDDCPLIAYQPGYSTEEQIWEQVEASFGGFLLRQVTQKIKFRQEE